MSVQQSINPKDLYGHKNEEENKMTIRKILALALVLIMVCSMAAMSVSAAAIEVPNIENTDMPAGMPADAKDVKYLSDLHDAADPMKATDNFIALENGEKVTVDENYNECILVFVAGARKAVDKTKVDAEGYRQLDNGKWHKTDIALGFWGTKYEKGLGVYPNGVDTIGTADYGLVYKVSGLGNYFYAVVGGTDHAVTNPDPSAAKYQVDFELWASKDATYSADAKFELIAQTQDIHATDTAEFNVEITGYNYIKLVVKMDSNAPDNQLSACVWANAAVYTGTPSTPSTPSNPETADTFSALPVALLVLSGAAVAVIIKKKEN